MFNKPIRHVRIADLEELMQFSYQVIEHCEGKFYCQNNGQIAFSDGSGNVMVTPYRSEIEDILKSAGYKYGCLYVPFSNEETKPEAYIWLAKIANEENWAETYEKAAEIAKSEGIKEAQLNLAQIKQVKQISEGYNDTATNTYYTAMVKKYLLHDTGKNIGTYIVVDDKTLMVCDEYGRTFLIKVKTVVNDTVNSLIEAGYKRTTHPEWYVHHYDSDETTSN